MNSAAAMTIPNGSSSRRHWHWQESHGQGHSVQFYEQDSHLLEGVSQFIGAAVLAGDSALVIATKSHREGLALQFGSLGLNLAPAMNAGRFQWMDAAETLKKFMRDGEPDFARFEQAVGEPISQLAGTGAKPRRIAAYGEMVALLWADGNRQAAIRLEQFWNRLAERHSFYLHCAYPLEQFSGEEDGGGLQFICAEHSHIVPGEQYTDLTDDVERLRAIVSLQQKAQALQTEIQERKKIELALQERETELREFLEDAAIGIHWTAADGTILWANRAELSLLGYTREEYVGRNISEFHLSSVAAQDILQSLAGKEELHGYEARLRCKDGSIRHVRIDSNTLMRDGRLLQAGSFTTDITARKQSEQALYQLAAIVASSDDAIISKDLNGIVTSWNDGAERMFGYRAEEIIGKPITTLIPPEFYSDETLILGRIRAGERIEHFETERITKNGERIQVSLTVSPVKDQRGKIVGAAKIARNITQQRKMEAKLHTSERLASVGRLAATVAHEINNPLEAVTNLIYLAKLQPQIPDLVQRYMSAADEELRRVAHITQQTLGFYRDNSQPVSLQMSIVIRDVLAIYERKLQQKHLEIEQSIESGLVISTLQGELKQILSNLIANAIDACRNGGRIIIRARSSSHLPSGRRGARITIADNGTGIPDQYKPSLFDPFFTTKKDVGTGLGLWITNDLLVKKGGNIRFRSRDSGRTGTVMRIFLPPG